MAAQIDYDLLILDPKSPLLDGIVVLRSLRGCNPKMPILVLTAENRVEKRVECLDLGADDYLTKPFSFIELSARYSALLRRGQLPATSALTVADLKLDLIERRVERGGTPIDLTSKEFSFLEYMMRNSGRRVTRAMIIEHVWNLSFDTSTNIVDVYVNYLRRKIDKGFARPLIHTVRGVGYELSNRLPAPSAINPERKLGGPNSLS